MLASVIRAVAAAGGPHAFWYLARASGLCAYLLLCFDVVLGLSVRTRALEPWLTRWRAFDLHQFTGLLVLGLAGLHVVALLGDGYFRFTLSQLLVPLATPYRPLWTALGIIGLYLLAGIVVSFSLRRYIGYRAWRTIHYLTFVAFLAALLHGLFAGTDTAEPWARLLYWITGLGVGGLIYWRFRLHRRPGRLSTLERPARARASASRHVSLV